MKVVFLLTLCVTSAFGQTISNCFVSAAFNYGINNQQCAQEAGNALSMFSPPITDSDLNTLCNSGCVRSLFNFINQQCGIDVLGAACSRDSNRYCIATTYQQTLTTELAALTASGGPCFNTDCSDMTCASAVDNLSCCYRSADQFAMSLIGSQNSAFSLPAQCTLPQTCGAMATAIFMPVALLAALIIAVMSVV